MDVLPRTHGTSALLVRDSAALPVPAAFPELDIPDATIKHLITRLVISRAASVRGTNPQLADEFLTLAIIGNVEPVVYAAVLRGDDDATLKSIDGRIRNWFRAAA